MKKRVILVVALVLAMPLVALGGTTPGSGFASSVHDFSGENAGTAQRSGAGVTTGPCTFCHTPHKAQETRLLWNHTLSANTFTWSDVTTTMGGTPLPTIATTWTGPTKFCLSCHDGSVAIGDIAWFNRQAWTGAAALDTTKHDSGQYNIASPTGDMAGNHPVAHPYPYQQAQNDYNGTQTGADVYVADFAADPTASGIRLFNEVSPGIVAAGVAAGKTGIECTSCHGVHNEVGIVQDEPLLRGKIGGASDPDYICMKCHTR